MMLLPDQGYGQLYMYTPNTLVAMRTGGGWATGVRAGARAVYLSRFPWRVDSGQRVAVSPVIL